MLYARIIFIFIFLLVVSYYITLLGHLFGAWKLTSKKIEVNKFWIPFYYWIETKQTIKNKKHVK